MSIYKLRTEFGHYMKPILFLIALIFLVGAIYSFGTAPMRRDGSGRGAGGAIAKVNNVEISRADFENVWDRALEEAKMRGIRSPLQYADMRASEFQRMINDITMLQAASAMGVDVSDRKVDKEIEKAVTMYLSQNREGVLGKKKYAESDPRKDNEYKRELATINSSLAQQEEYAKSRIPRNQVKAQLAQQGIVARIRGGIKPVTEADITASYNVYKIRQIVIPTGGVPTEQAMSRANKIVAEAKAGADFAKLARENSQGGAPGQMDLTFENSFYFPQQVKDAIEKTKPGDISPVISARDALYVIKVEGVSSKLPANLDKKAKDQRRKQIEQMREMAAGMQFQQDMTKNQRVEVTDAEFLGYWNLLRAQRAFGNPVEQKKYMNMAIAALERARTEHPNNYIAVTKLIQLYNEQGQYEKGIRLLYPMLEGTNATIEGADIRILLGDMLLKKGEKDRAIQQYKTASEVAMNDLNLHQQLLAKFQQLKQPDLVAAENKWIADYNTRAAEMKKLEQKNPRPPMGPGAPGQPMPPPRPKE